MSYIGNVELFNSGKPLLSALISASANTTLVAAVAGKTVKVYAVKLLSAPGSVVSWKDTASVAIEGSQTLPATGGFAESVDPPASLFSVPSGKGLVLVTTASVAGRVSYWTEKHQSHKYNEIEENGGMSKSDTFENDLMLLIFNNIAIANIGDVAGLRAANTAGTFWVSLHTADPGEAGTAVTNETAYTGYVRISLARSSDAFAVTLNSVSPVANIDFAECIASPGAAITHFGIVNTFSGAGKLLYSGTVTPNITMATGVIPRLKTTSTITED